MKRLAEGITYARVQPGISGIAPSLHPRLLDAHALFHWDASGSRVASPTALSGDRKLSRAAESVS